MAPGAVNAAAAAAAELMLAVYVLHGLSCDRCYLVG
jgi:hypothetical protein